MVGGGHHHERRCARVDDGERPDPTVAGEPGDTPAAPQSPRAVQGWHGRELVGQTCQPPGRRAGAATPPTPVVERRHGVDEPGTGQQPRGGRRQEDEPDKADHGRAHDRPTSPQVVAGTFAVEPHEDGGRHDEVEGRVVVAARHSQHGDALEPVVQPTLGVEMEVRLDAHEIPPDGECIRHGSVRHRASSRVGVVETNDHSGFYPHHRQSVRPATQADHPRPPRLRPEPPGGPVFDLLLPTQTPHLSLNVFSRVPLRHQLHYRQRIVPGGSDDAPDSRRTA